jgi:hypothetical protein
VRSQRSRVGSWPSFLDAGESRATGHRQRRDGRVVLDAVGANSVARALVDQMLTGARVFPQIAPAGETRMAVINSGPVGATSEFGFTY